MSTRPIEFLFNGTNPEPQKLEGALVLTRQRLPPLITRAPSFATRLRWSEAGDWEIARTFLMGCAECDVVNPFLRDRQTVL